MAALAVVPETQIEELTRQVNAEHELALGAARRTIDHAIRCGQLLTQIQELVGYGNWKRWLDELWAADNGTARTYIRIAAYHETLPASAKRSIHSAKQALRGLPPVGLTESWNSVRADAKVDAKRLHQEGWSYQQIAEMFDVSKNTVQRWCKPDQARREERHRKAARSRARAARRALRQQERERATRAALKAKKGTALAESYSLMRKLSQELERADAEAGQRDVRLAIRDAQAALHNVEDALVRGLGVAS